MDGEYSVAEVEARIVECANLVQQYEALAIQARAERRRWRRELVQARRREKLAIQATQTHRPRGRPLKQYALSAEERQRRHKLHKEAKRLSKQEPGVEVICILKKK